MRGKWANHVAKVQDVRWTKRITEKTPREGKRLKACPRKDGEMKSRRKMVACG